MTLPAARATAEPLSKQFTIVIGLTVVGFMGFGFTLSLYRTMLFERTLANMETENRKINERIDEGFRDLEYYQSTQFKDKYAKENLRKINPGENVMILTNPPASDAKPIHDDQEKEGEKAAFLEILRQMPVIEHWKLYFFHRDELEELRREL